MKLILCQYWISIRWKLLQTFKRNMYVDRFVRYVIWSTRKLTSRQLRSETLLESQPWWLRLSYAAGSTICVCVRSLHDVTYKMNAQRPDRVSPYVSTREPLDGKFGVNVMPLETISNWYFLSNLVILICNFVITNMAGAWTCEVGVTLVPLTYGPQIMYFGNLPSKSR
jgi:uncharacterized membrane protein YhaH (DUF805 family)